MAIKAVGDEIPIQTGEVERPASKEKLILPKLDLKFDDDNLDRMLLNIKRSRQKKGQSNTTLPAAGAKS